MNDMARGDIDITATKSSLLFKNNQEELKPLSELEAFSQLDELLDDLNKQYLDAKAYCQQLVAQFGKDDAMVNVAMDMEDSAWCAMQTRYLEVRLSRVMMLEVQSMMRLKLREIEEKKERAVEKEKHERARNFANYLRYVELRKEQNKKIPDAFDWAMVLLFLGINMFGESMNKKSLSYTMAA